MLSSSSLSSSLCRVKQGLLTGVIILFSTLLGEAVREGHCTRATALVLDWRVNEGSVAPPISLPPFRNSVTASFRAESEVAMREWVKVLQIGTNLHCAEPCSEEAIHLRASDVMSMARVSRLDRSWWRPVFVS